MNAAVLLYDLEARGVHVREREGAVVITPAKLVRPAELDALRTLKPHVLAYLRGKTLGTDWSLVSLWQLDKVLEIAVPWADVPLILAPGCRIARELRERDPKPGRVWCVCEALDLLLTNVPPEDARKIAEVKLLFGGSIAGVGPSGAPAIESRPESAGLERPVEQLAREPGELRLLRADRGGRGRGRGPDRAA